LQTQKGTNNLNQEKENNEDEKIEVLEEEELKIKTIEELKKKQEEELKTKIDNSTFPKEKEQQILERTEKINQAVIDSLKSTEIAQQINEIITNFKKNKIAIEETINAQINIQLDQLEQRKKERREKSKFTTNIITNNGEPQSMTDCNNQKLILKYKKNNTCPEEEIVICFIGINEKQPNCDFIARLKNAQNTPSFRLDIANRIKNELLILMQGKNNNELLPTLKGALVRENLSKLYKVEERTQEEKRDGNQIVQKLEFKTIKEPIDKTKNDIINQLRSTCFIGGVAITANQAGAGNTPTINKESNLNNLNLPFKFDAKCIKNF